MPRRPRPCWFAPFASHRPVVLVVPVTALAIATVGGVAMVTSITLSSTEVTVGATVGVRLVVDSAPPPGPVTITLSSSAPSVLAVPASITTSVTSPRTASFTSRAAAPGCATIFARAGESPSRAAMLAVHPPPPSPTSWASASLAAGTVRGGTPATLILQATHALSGNLKVQLAVDNTSLVVVPASVTVPTTGEVVKVELPTKPVASRGCAVVIATFAGNVSVRRLLQVVP